jgi:hypothetical protein
MDLNRPRLRSFVSCSTGPKLVSGARRLPQPAAGPANGGGSEVLSVVPPGSSSEAMCSEQLRIDWNKSQRPCPSHSLLGVGPDLKLAWPALMRFDQARLGRSAGGGRAPIVWERKAAIHASSIPVGDATVIRARPTVVL